LSYGDVKRGYPQQRRAGNRNNQSKGGVGKSTTAVNLSAALGELKKKCLSLILTHKETRPADMESARMISNNDIYDVIMNEIPIESTIQSTVEETSFSFLQRYNSLVQR